MIRCLFPVAAVLVILSAGCNKRPDKVLSDDEMVSLIADMQLAESYWNLKSSGSADVEQRELMGKRVLAAHGVTVEQLDTSLSWYGRNMDTYEELYAKVDREIASRRKKLMKGSADDIEMDEGNNLWPYGRHGVISSLGISDGYVFSVSSDNLEKGDAVEWKMNITPSVQVQGVLGVEYEGGDVSYVHRLFQGSSSKFEMRVQTDTARVVSRVFGTLRVKDTGRLPVMTDSISLVRLPLDSTLYYRMNGQQNYSGPHRKVVK